MKRALILGFVLIVLVLAAFSQTTRNTSDKNKSDEQTTPPVVSINPSNIDFKDQVAKKPSKPVRVTVTNSGG